MQKLPHKVLTYAEHASDIIATAADLIWRGQPFALITSLAIEGGAAREIGSLALVVASGEMHILTSLANAPLFKVVDLWLAFIELH